MLPQSDKWGVIEHCDEIFADIAERFRFLGMEGPKNADLLSSNNWNLDRINAYTKYFVGR